MSDDGGYDYKSLVLKVEPGGSLHRKFEVLRELLGEPKGRPERMSDTLRFCILRGYQHVAHRYLEKDPGALEAAEARARGRLGGGGP